MRMYNIFNSTKMLGLLMPRSGTQIVHLAWVALSFKLHPNFYPDHILDLLLKLHHISLDYIKSQNRMPFATPGADSGFPLGGAPTLRGCQHAILPNFPKNCMKLRKLWAWRGRPLRSTNECIVSFWIGFLINGLTQFKTPINLIN